MRLEPIKNPTLARKLTPPAIALFVTIVIASLLAMVAGANPFTVIGLILKGAFGSTFAILRNAQPRDAVDIHGPRCRRRVSRQVLEHRGRGTALCWRFNDGLTRDRRFALAELGDLARYHYRSNLGRRRRSFGSGPSENAVRRR